MFVPLQVLKAHFYFVGTDHLALIAGYAQAPLYQLAFTLLGDQFRVDEHSHFLFLRDLDDAQHD